MFNPKPGKHLSSGRNHAERGDDPAGWRDPPAGWRVSPAGKSCSSSSSSSDRGGGSCGERRLLESLRAPSPPAVCRQTHTEVAHYVAIEKSRPSIRPKTTCAAPRPRPEAAKKKKKQAHVSQSTSGSGSASLTRSRYLSPFQNSEHVCAHFRGCLCPSASAGALRMADRLLRSRLRGGSDAAPASSGTGLTAIGLLSPLPHVIRGSLHHQQVQL